ncbi:HPr family phosphocarrier protein [Telmatospirillum siberiense]|uniref:HPr family phosphocarrier protein n=1 Tax=Telmatospirillum siberiense TaxID=382514 RepID=A0A2N3PM62_9PROT|nr:HPr family phosphocarrier protein [Telmatospirillum siberiense]PKU21498.1 HPr family phosphocarrier protein [Telmatospirillum siberiense]
MPTDSAIQSAAGELSRSATITNRRGLHARAAAKFVKLASQFQAQVLVSNRGIEVSGLSIMGLMMLAAGPGSNIELKGSGADAAEALEALGALIDAKFDED